MQLHAHRDVRIPQSACGSEALQSAAGRSISKEPARSDLPPPPEQNPPAETAVVNESGRLPGQRESRLLSGAATTGTGGAVLCWRKRSSAGLPRLRAAAKTTDVVHE